MTSSASLDSRHFHRIHWIHNFLTSFYLLNPYICDTFTPFHVSSVTKHYLATTFTSTLLQIVINSVTYSLPHNCLLCHCLYPRSMTAFSSFLMAKYQFSHHFIVICFICPIQFTTRRKRSRNTPFNAFKVLRRLSLVFG